MKTLLLFSDDQAIRTLVAQLDGYRLVLPDTSPWHEQSFDFCLLDISACSGLNKALLEHISAVTSYLLVVADLSDQDHLAAYDAAHGYLIKPLTAPRLEKALVSLTYQDAEIAEYIGHLRHELKNPLSSILGYTDLLLSVREDAAVRDNIGSLTDSQFNFLQSIHRSATKLHKMIDELGEDD